MHHSIMAPAYADGDSTTSWLLSPSCPRLISPTLNLVQPCFDRIVFLYPFLLLSLNFVSTGPLVCSNTVNSQSTTSFGMLGSSRASQSIRFRKSLASAAGARIA